MGTIRELEIELDSLRTATDTIVGNLIRTGTTCESLGAGLHAAIVLKEHHRYAEAERVFAYLKSHWPREQRFAYEYVQFLRRVGRDEEADAVLVDALDAPPAGDLLRECIIRGLVERPDTQVRTAILEALTWAASDGLSGYDRGIVNFFASAEIRQTLAGGHRPKQDIEESFEMCLKAIRSRTPFCLLRLGDGDGAFVNALACPSRQEALFLNHREHYTTRSFGDRPLASDERFLTVARDVWAGLSEADIIGIPQPAWLAHEIRIRSIRLIINCLQLVKLAAEPRFDKRSRFTSTTIAVDLAYRGLMDKLIAERPVRLITSHAELGARLEAAGRAEVREVIPIPPFHSDLALTGYAQSQSHFRDAFDGVNARIDLISPGDVVLVAAGILGKSYCLRIKRNGGIALDLGSLVDLWMGYETRPSFTGLSQLRLSDRMAS